MSEPAHAVTEEERPPDGPRPPDMEAETTEALAAALAEVRAIARDVFELSQVQLERARMGVRSGVFNAKMATWRFIAAVTTTIVAVYFIIDGLSGGLSELLGSVWAGRLAAGLLVMVLLALVVQGFGAAERRSNVKRMRRKFGEPDKPAGDER